MSNAPERLRAALTDRYRIERELGQGGMAAVYLAQDLKHDRKVALKVLRPELAAVLGANVSASSGLTIGPAQELFVDTTYLRAPSYRGYDVARDDRSFIMLRVIPETDTGPTGDLIFVDNWFTELSRKGAKP